MTLRAANNTLFRATVVLLFIVPFARPALAQGARKVPATRQLFVSSSAAAMPVAIPSRPQNPDRILVPESSGMSPGRLRAWLLLGIAQHGAAFFDAKTTRDAMRTHQELDPLLRPFAHSAALYPVMQIAPTGLDWLGLRLASSRHRWLRKMWWLPQAAATAGFLWSATHNLRLPAAAPR
jgi:hypothetical protein